MRKVFPASCLIFNIFDFSAIKTGRYTHAKRTRDIEELKRIEKKQKVEDNTEKTQEKEDTYKELLKQLAQAKNENPYYDSDFIDKLETRQKDFMVSWKFTRKCL